MRWPLTRGALKVPMEILRGWARGGEEAGGGSRTFSNSDIRIIMIIIIITIIIIIKKTYDSNFNDKTKCMITCIYIYIYM